MKYINLHTHHDVSEDDIFAIRNLDALSHFNATDYFSVGFHPWYLPGENEKLKLATQRNVLAIGECGLDRLSQVDFELQISVFTEQIQLANQLNKPLIIHCVKAHQEVLSLLKKEDNKQSVIFHGFNNRESILDEIITAGGFVSLGPALRNESLQEVVRGIPLGRVFLETDDKESSIQELYQLASEVFSISISELQIQIATNFARVFGISNTL